MVISFKKIALFLITVQVLLIFSACNFDLYYGKRPFDYGNAKWVSKEPSIWFVVDIDDEQYYSPKGEIIIDNQTIEASFRFITETNQLFIDLIKSNSASYDSLLNGVCEFYPDKMILKVEKESDNLFNEKYDTITFIKEPIE
jgi:hypothetical protein